MPNQLDDTLREFAEPLGEWLPSCERGWLMGFAAALWNASARGRILAREELDLMIRALCALPDVSSFEARWIVRALLQRRTFRYGDDPRLANPA